VLFFLLIWAIAANWIAIKKGFYKLPSAQKSAPLSVSLFQLLASFGIYLLLALVFAPLFARFVLGFIRKLQPDLFSLPSPVITGIYMGTMLIVLLLLQLFLYSQNSILYKKIWKNREHSPSRSIEFDWGLGISAWALSFPIVSILSDGIDKLLQKLVGYNHLEQTAVKFVKAAMSNPFSLVFVLVSTTVLAPLIEEFLFRGVLQTYLKKRLGAISAILLSAALFALFHFSPSQGWGNLSLLVSLFLLGGYLGFLYERQASLWAPIGLHMTFNVISALRIVFFPETS